MELSAAHRRSAFAVIDPVYDALKPNPPAKESLWLYPRGAYEKNTLVRLYNEMMSSRLLVCYDMARNWQTYGTYHYRRHMNAGSIFFETASKYVAKLDGEILREGDAEKVELTLEKAGELTVDVTAIHHRFLMPALASSDDGWEVAEDDDMVFHPALRGGKPDWDTSLPTTGIAATEFRPDCYDLGRECLVKVEIYCKNPPRFTFGESLAELDNENTAVSEQPLEVISHESGVWTPTTLIACRYLRIISKEPYELKCHGLFTPEQYRGAFASDNELTNIWMRSVYTLRLCAYHFLIDGIKRDRLPWMGDHLVSMLSDAYSFGDGEICKRTLTVLGAPGIEFGDINGLVDYSLWLPIASHHFQLYWGDRAFLERQYPEVKATMQALLKCRTADGLLDCTNRRLFIDWTPECKESAGQVLFFYSLQTMAKLADRMDDKAFAQETRQRAQTVKEYLLNTTFDTTTGLFHEKVGDRTSGFNRYANMLAILGEMVDDATTQRLGEALSTADLPPVGTPYMASLEILALHRSGQATAAMQKLRKLWGAMLKDGATTFWEGYSETEKGDERYVFYGRPFGKSLCHAWSSGPAFLLPLMLFGCEPVEDGWRRFRLEASPLLQEGDCICVPTPKGNIEAEFRNGKLELTIPEGLTRIP